MAKFVAHEVLPDVALRKWLISFLFATHFQAMGKVLEIVYLTMASRTVHKTGLQFKDASTGVVTLMQRFGSALYANIILGFRNCDIRVRLVDSPLLQTCRYCVTKQSAQIFRLLERFHMHGLIAKVSRTRSWFLNNERWEFLSAAFARLSNGG